MSFGKIENGELKLLKMPLKIDGKDVFTNDESIILKNGYKPIEYTLPEEKDGLFPVPKFKEQESKIVQEWEYVKE